MADLPERAERSWVRGLIRLPARRHVAAFLSLTTGGQGEAALSFIAVAILIRLAGPDEAGEVFFAQALASVWFLVCDPRLDDTAQRYIPVHQAQGKGSGTWLFQRLLGIDVLGGMIIAVVGTGVVVAVHSAGWLDDGQALLVVLALLANGATAAAGTAIVGFAVSGRLGRLGGVRLGAAGLTAAVAVVALVVAGPIGYLGATAVAGILTTTGYAMVGRRYVVAALGPPCRGPGRLPAGLVRFTVKSSAASSLAVAADTGVLTLAGILGSAALVTFLKVATAPARLFATGVSPVVQQLYPRLAAAAVAQDGVAVRRDATRATALLGLLGALAVAGATPLMSWLLATVYGPAYRGLGPAAAVLLAAAGLRGTTLWAKVLPLALGRPGLRLLFVAGEGVALLAALAVATRHGSATTGVVAAFAWANVVVAAVLAGLWLALLLPLTAQVGQTATRVSPTATVAPPRGGGPGRPRVRSTAGVADPGPAPTGCPPGRSA